MKLTKNILISLLAILIGVGGLVFCLVPGYSAPDKAVAKYVSAINRGSMKGMAACQINESDLHGIGSDLFDSDLKDKKVDPDNKIYSCLKESGLSAYRRLPKDAVKVKKVALCGCVNGEKENFDSMVGFKINAVVKVTYIDKDNEEQSFYCDENFAILKIRSKYKIVNI